MKNFKLILSIVTMLMLNLAVSAGIAAETQLSFGALFGSITVASVVGSLFVPTNLVFSLLATRIQNFRVASDLDKFELRPSRWGALDLFLMQTDDPAGIISPDLKERALSSIGSSVQVPVIDDEDVSIGNTRTLTIAASENTSALVTISFTTYAFGFTMVPAMFSNNEISMQRDFNAKMRKYLNKFADVLDTEAITQLALNKTQVFNDTLAYSKAGNTVIAKYAERDMILGDINPMMSANDYYGRIHLLGNTGMESIIRKLAENGIQNATNKTLEYADKILHFSNRVSNPAGKYASAYAVQEGSLGVLTRMEREAILMTKTGIGYEWGQQLLPMIGLPCGTYYYETVEDMNAIAGAATADLDRALVQHFGFAVDLGFITAYNSNASARPQPIMKITVNTADTDADTTAPTVAFTSSSGLTNIVITFSESMCSDKAGTLLTGDVKALFGISAHATITSATVSNDAKTVTFVIANTALAENDYLQTIAALYDANGNALAANTHIAKCSATPLWIAA